MATKPKKRRKEGKMQKLKETEYEKVGPLFKGLEWSLYATAVIEGMSPGWIYVDNTDSPKSAFMSTLGGYYLAGCDNNSEFNASVNRLIFEKLFKGDALRKNETDVEVDFYPESWENKMPTIFKGRLPLEAVRRHYVCTELKDNAWRGRVPEKFRILQFDAKLLRRPHVKVPENAIESIEEHWGSQSAFLETGIGFCTLHNNKIVSWSMTDCIANNACEIGVQTDEEYRRRGLATLTVAAIVSFCLSSGFKYVGWHCDEYNLPSIKTAEKVGFKLERKYIQYYACPNKAHHLEETAQAHFRARRYKEAIECYEKFFATPPEKLPDWLREALPQEMGTHYFRVAYSKASTGENNDALRYLEKAVDNGWLYIDYLRNCKEFENMHGTAAWHRILQKIQKKAKEANAK